MKALFLLIGRLHEMYGREPVFEVLPTQRWNMNHHRMIIIQCHLQYKNSAIKNARIRLLRNICEKIQFLHSSSY